MFCKFLVSLVTLYTRARANTHSHTHIVSKYVIGCVCVFDIRVSSLNWQLTRASFHLSHQPRSSPIAHWTTHTKQKSTSFRFNLSVCVCSTVGQSFNERQTINVPKCRGVSDVNVFAVNSMWYEVNSKYLILVKTSELQTDGVCGCALWYHFYGLRMSWFTFFLAEATDTHTQNDKISFRIFNFFFRFGWTHSERHKHTETFDSMKWL